ncbi:hypothetical protein EBESD8_27390 [Rhodococcus aetherivorans]|nr:hypothetical protein EBESD8_27390 [Rhodococcus aetherivorans]
MRRSIGFVWPRSVHSSNLWSNSPTVDNLPTERMWHPVDLRR